MWEMWEEVEAAGLECGFKEGGVQGLVPGVCLGDVEMVSRSLRGEMQEEE